MHHNPTAWTRQEEETLRARPHPVQNGATRIRFRIVLHTAEEYTQPQIAEMLACSIRTVARVRQRFRERGIEGLMDQRGDNVAARITDDYTLALIEAVRGSAQDYGYRPSWGGQNRPVASG